ncbi:MAG: ABC-F family ATP-binding cassette domain-containing protein [Schwartzia sp.]|nr:ABC-F family ATP-binding cassette domain-containing protein [Schwartzia sp. (in: firmicutes)]
MRELSVSGFSKSFGTLELFHDVSFRVARGERAGLVGANGAGKTTLMRCLLGEEEPDGGAVRLEASETIGYVEQQASLGAGTLHEEFRDAFSDILRLGEKKKAMEREIGRGGASEELLAEYGRVVLRFEHMEGYDVESRIRRVAFGLGFTDDDLTGSVAHLSGGQKTRVCLAKALLREPDFLFLDEPTNHLDIRMIEWLEDFLCSYRGGVLLISHDRFFLDRVATKIISLEHRTATVYAGNYSYYQKVRDERRAALESAYEKQQEKIRETEEYIRRYRAGIKAKQARGRQSQLDRMERIVLPPEKARFDYFAFHPPGECAERVAEAEDLAAAFGGHLIFSHLSLLVRRGDGVAIVGANGEGKTTLLRLIVGELSPAAGSVKLGSRVKIGYFSQQHEGLHKERTVLEEILYEFGMDEESARGCLGAFLFRGDEVERVIGELSGGEQSRLAFLKLMLTGANFLVLDEPTNHLDIPAKEAVEEALMAFPGTFLVVSHDRYFLDRVANVTLELADGKLTRYEGGYSYYKGKKAEREARADDRSVATKEPKRESTAQKKEIPAESEKRVSSTGMSAEKRTELLLRAEAELAMAEAELKMLEREMNNPTLQQNPEESRRIAEEYAAKEAEIEQRYEKWGALAEQA